jgi:DNA-binding FadR family transcriptional regulator
MAAMDAARDVLAPGRAWEVVLQSIESALLDGRLRPGDHLPPERQLATDLGVGRSSVREAVRVLEVLGLVRTATGSGPNAGAIIVSTPSGGMSALMRLQVAAQGFRVGDVVKTRLLLETSVAAELADARHRNRSGRGGGQLPQSRHLETIAPGGVAPLPQGGAIATEGAASGPAGADKLAGARQLLDAMDSPALSVAEFLALDAQFHVALAEASGNEVVAAMMAGLRDSIERYVQAAAATLPSWDATSTRLRAEHRSILDAIEAGSPADASRRVHEHITGYYAESALTDAVPHAHLD